LALIRPVQVGVVQATNRPTDGAATQKTGSGGTFIGHGGSRFGNLVRSVGAGLRHAVEDDLVDDVARLGDPRLGQ
jgi:hypothetical protein